MLTYSFENIGHTPLYEHLYKCIKNDIMNGTLPAGTKLPSKRSFASNLGVSAITVENAYAQLLSEGYIYSRPKKGYYVSTFSRHLLPLCRKQDRSFLRTFPVTRPGPTTFLFLSGQS